MRDDEFLTKRRTKFFYTFIAICALVDLSILIVTPITMATAIFFKVVNRSNFVEIGNLFQEIDIFLQGNCIKLNVEGELCRKVSFPEMFYKFPDFSRIPVKVAPEDLPNIFSAIPGQNPIVFIALFFFEALALLSLVFVVRAYIGTTKRRIVSSIIVSLFVLLFSAIALGISDKIYGDVLPNALNKPLSVQVTRNNELVTVNGRPGDVGIKFIYGEGRNNLIALLSLSVVLFLGNVRLWFEGTTPEKLSSRIRVNDVPA